jgi:hypothetical protein
MNYILNLIIHCLRSLNSNKMKKSLFIILIIFGISVYFVNAQDTIKFKPSGKVEALIFTNFNHSSTGGQSVSKFEVTRAYFGYAHNFSPTLFGRVVMDFGNPGVGGLQLTGLLKYAYLQYQKQNLTMKFGLISTTSFDVQEKFWGNRYILKSFQDQYGMGPSADFGLSAAYKFNEVISADLMVQNGEGFKVNDVDSVLKISVGLTLHPVKELTLRGYYDNMKKDSAAQQTVAVMAGYANKKFSIGVEYNYQADNKLKKGYDFSGYSVYGTCYINPKTDLFARYDNLTSATAGSSSVPWNYSKDGQLLMFGFEYIPVKGIRIAPNYQLWNPRDSSKSSTSSFFFNVEIKI